MSYVEYLRNHDRNNVIYLKEIERRYLAVLKPIHIPILTLDEVEALFWVEYRSEFYGNGNAKDIILHWVDEHKLEFICNVDYDRRFAETAAERNDRSAPDTPMHDALIKKIKGWSQLECLKVLKIFEDMYLIRLKGMDATYRTAYHLLNALRNDQT